MLTILVYFVIAFGILCVAANLAAPYGVCWLVAWFLAILIWITTD